MTDLSRLTALALLGGALLMPAEGQAADIYLAAGLPYFSPYRLAVATIDVAGGKVTGTLAPPVGDPRPALPLSGVLADGKLNLTIGSGAEAVTIAFAEGQRDQFVLWEEAKPIADVQEVVLFKPEGGLSEAALALQHEDSNWCGRMVGGLSVTLRADALKAAREAPKGLSDLKVALSARAEGASASVGEMWPRLRLAALSGDDVVFDVAVPVGDEAAQAETLRKLREVAAVELPFGCGEMALVPVPRDRIMDGATVSEAKLKAYADQTLSRFLSGADAEASAPGTRKFKLLNAKVEKGADGRPRYTAQLTGDADVTRLGTGQVDAFTLSLTPLQTAADTAETFSLIPHVSDLKSAKKTGNTPVPDSAFRPVEDESLPVAIDHRLISWIAATEGTNCAFLTQTSFEEPEGSLGCSNLSLDTLGEEGD